MLNPYQYTWILINTDKELPTIGREVYILVEHDVIGMEDDPYTFNEYPFVRCAKLMNEPGPSYLTHGRVQWALLDANEDEDTILHQDVGVIAWRYFSDKDAPL